VHTGDRVVVGQPLLAYLNVSDIRSAAPAPPEPRVPIQPFRNFIQALTERRESLRSARAASVDALIARHRAAAVMVFGVDAVSLALVSAEGRLFGSVVKPQLALSFEQPILRIRVAAPMMF